MTDEEYMQQLIKEYKRRGRGTSPHLDDDPDVEDDFFDMINLLEELE